MGDVSGSNLAYAHPGGDLLFSGIDFKVPAGAHVGIVGRNGVGKTTLLRVLAGELEADDGAAALNGRVAFMPQDVGVRADEAELTVRGLLIGLLPSALRSAGRRMADAERRLAEGDDSAGMELGEAIGTWSQLGGYELEAAWDVACRTIVRDGFESIADRPAVTLSGGERKRLVLEALFASDAEILLLDEPDNFLDVPAKRELERRVATTAKTVLMISHDRVLLEGAVNRILTLEGNGCWIHHGSYATYGEAREARQKKLGDAVRRWEDEEKRLRELVRVFKERARYSPVWAKKADAAESRWKRYVAEGPPPPPVADQSIRIRMRGGDSARKAVALKQVALDGLVKPASHEVHFGERVGLVGPNGAGKTHLLSLIGGTLAPDAGEVVLGPRVSAGLFSQLNRRQDFAGANVLELILDRAGGTQAAMGALARYGLVDASRRTYDTLSGGQKARLEILALELEGHNLLLLDEPTDNLDIDSCEALEHALESFEGTVIAASHDRAHLRTLDRFLLLGHDGRLRELPDVEAAFQSGMT